MKEKWIAEMKRGLDKMRGVYFEANIKNNTKYYIMKLSDEDFIQFEGSNELEQKEWCKTYLQNLIEITEVVIVEDDINE